MAFTNKSTISVQSSVSTATNRLNYFFREGKKGITESKRRTRFKIRARKKVSNLSEDSIDLSSRFKAFFISATPFIGLKTRRMRRGKRVLNKVSALTRIASQRKSYMDFASSFYSSGRAKKPLMKRFEQELDTIYSNTRKRIVSSQTNTPSLYDKQITLYTTAYAAIGSISKKSVKKKRTFLSSSGVEHMAVNH